jgi:iron only hydrogenase large subunit-like protein
LPTWYEVAVGADLCVIEEANDYLDEVPKKHSFMVTSCCPSWSDMVKKMFPEFTDNISVALTPMVLTARMIKNSIPAAGWCSWAPATPKSWRPAASASAATWISC